MGIFTDLKKAFYTINHDLLFNKPEKYGIRGDGIDWVSSYLRNRQQSVEIGEHKCIYMSITCGVPQGSVLGPELFIIYMNDVQSIRYTKIFNFLMTQIFFLFWGQFTAAFGLITTEMNKLKQWFDVNRLQLNISKTKIVIWKTNTKVELKIDNISIERVH